MLRRFMKKARSAFSGSGDDDDKQKNIIVVNGDIAKFQEADVLVNPILNAVDSRLFSKSFGEWAPDELRKKYDEAGPPERFGSDVTITDSAGSICAKKIFHVTIGRYCNKSSLERLTCKIKVCLTAVESLAMTSIAFPTLGCGSLRYYAGDVAKCFLEAAQGTKLQIYIVANKLHHYEIFRETFPTKKLLRMYEQEVQSVVSDKPTPLANSTASQTKQSVDNELIEMAIHHSAIANLTQEFMGKIQDLQSKEVQINFELDQSTVTLKGNRKLSLEVKQRILILLAEDELLQKNLDYIKRSRGVKEYLVALSEERRISYPDYSQNLTCSGQSKLKYSYSALAEGSPAFEAVKALILQTWKSNLVGFGADARGLTHRGISIEEICMIENPLLYANYQFRLKALALKAAHKPFSNVSDFFDEPEIRTAKTAGAEYLNSRLIREVNEVYLFHGTSKMHEIAKYGIDCRLSGDKVLFGRGAYFAESSTKSDQYAGCMRTGKHKRWFMFVARVLLGEPYIAQSARPDLKKAPCMTLDFKKEDLTESHPMCDSVIGTHKDTNTRLLFREFIVYHPDQCYPEFLVTYARE